MTKPDTSEAQYLVEKLAGRLHLNLPGYNIPLRPELRDLLRNIPFVHSSIQDSILFPIEETYEEWVTRIMRESEE